MLPILYKMVAYWKGYGTVDIINIYVSFLIGVVTCAIAESVFYISLRDNLLKNKEGIFKFRTSVYDYILCYHTLCFYMLIKFVCDGENIPKLFC